MKTVLLIVAICSSMLLWGCMMSDGTGERGRNVQPVREYEPRDHSNDSTEGKQIRPSPPDFTSKQDTVKASLVVIPHVRRHEEPTPETISGRIFTIQIGAYVDAGNALRRQRLAKERFTTEPVFNEFDGQAHLYRVSVGRFSSKARAEQFLKTMQQTFPQEYGKCWVKEIEP